MTLKRNNGKALINFFLEEPNNTGLKFLKETRETKFKKFSGFKIPKAWKTIYFKLYPRLPQIELKGINWNENQLFSILKSRKSERKFKGKNISLEKISKILYFSAGIRNYDEIKNNFNESRRMYPSAGARYPLEIYPVILRSKEIPLGIYHYNLKWNSLELLLKGNFRKKFGWEITNQSWIKKSGMIIIITAVFSRTITKYKERGWRYIFFEAGHLAQNIYLISTLLKLKCCAIGGFIDEKVIEILDLNPDSEWPLYLVAVGY